MYKFFFWHFRAGNEILSLILISILCDIHDFDQIEEGECLDRGTSSCTDNENPPLPNGCPLKRIYDVQQLARNNYNIQNQHDESFKYIGGLVQKKNYQLMNSLTSHEKYMLGATALDCSIMITFQVLDSGEFR